MLSIFRFIKRGSCIFIFVLGLVLSGGKALASLCTYETWDWDSIQKKSVNHKKISKPVTELTEEERGQIAGCTVCEEDQVEVRLQSLPPFKVCKKFRDRIVRAVNQAVSARFPVHTIVGYRVGKSKGPLNFLGQRTQFSNHSYGTAIDINSELNGLYDFCFRFGPQCKLIRGGEYRKEVLGAISKSSSLYKAMIAEGFKWGGEIDGKQKDFMHFSLSGM